MLGHVICDVCAICFVSSKLVALLKNHKSGNMSFKQVRSCLQGFGPFLSARIRTTRNSFLKAQLYGLRVMRLSSLGITDFQIL